jgi:NADH-quinone oxidoreductase subunit G
MAAAVRKLGVDYVFDTNFAADLTIMEEASELLGRLPSKEVMFTSCCPGWVKFLTTQYPELTPNLSTAKSPQQMFGAVLKTWFAEREKLDPSKIFSVSIMPCMAKKYECELPGMEVDVDAVITVREFIRMVKASQMDVHKLGEEEFDSPLGEAAGAGIIFGATAGVMEAALRSAYYFVTGENPEPDAFSEIRERELELDIKGAKVKVVAVSGLGNARKLIERIKKGEADYDFVEVMACPGGCVNGGGQPIKDGCFQAPERSNVLYKLDKNAEWRFSHENPSIKVIYDEFLGKPMSEKAHKLLHREY